MNTEKVKKLSSPFSTLGDKTGVKLVLSNVNLFGRQTVNEYRTSSIERVDRELDTHGWQFLLKNPIDLCMIPTEIGLIPIIYDGHHRVRRSPKFGITKIPSYAYSLEQTAQFLGADPKDVCQEFLHQIGVAIESFSRRCEKYELPRPIEFNGGLEELSLLAKLAPTLTTQGLMGISTF